MYKILTSNLGRKNFLVYKNKKHFEFAQRLRDFPHEWKKELTLSKGKTTSQLLLTFHALNLI